ncbi:MAG: histidinol dehydrogenase [Dehalococcoidales bacterium]|nr:histidinol dehydrogenase [Dehalococcoidales bacterium]
MKIIEGFESAKSVLSRQAPKEMFSGDEREQAVRQIVNDVRDRGDVALFDYTEKFDAVRLAALEVDKEQIKGACLKVDSELLSALKLAAERISSFHRAQKDNVWGGAKPGSGQLLRPLERVGVYVPGGRASYPSTVLMTAIPAKVAGVKEVILTTPPGKDGAVPPLTLAAAALARVDRVFSVGGAQAVAALAFGTESVPRVDKICGPGNIFVALAKKLVYGIVGIDGIQGPSEVLIIADETADPEYCAADLLAQAEHDPLASAILLTTSPNLADRVNQEVKEQVKSLKRQAIVAESLENGGLIGVVNSIDEAIELANLYAPEHLCLMVDKAASYLDRISNAGCIVLGEKATVVLGDYMVGPSHVLPTAGTARFSSPLNVSDFIKLTSVVDVDKGSLQKLGRAAQTLATAEGLEAHARAIEKRLEN